ncbi:RidA family protein [Actibacterium sp. 188UL27-1]|uniref:RidA family protein n=1 Tax=Actibacterium sp. 188UL27-1 TaxID=2786961 RepID=UPI00195C34EF|nr:RidA family protein [Actibacterium sp. 188UL27-1]MBM7068305.1 RidA family protein [Actibacterium sp. 188UL27-1]
MDIRRIAGQSAFEPRIGYCRAVVVDGWVHVAGTTGNDPDTMTYPPDVVDQCRLALGYIEQALSEAGAGFADVVRVTYVLPDRADFEPCWPLLRAAFGDNPPAATMIECGLLSADMKIEIEVTAKLP